jgi:hypothetical protein
MTDDEMTDDEMTDDEHAIREMIATWLPASQAGSAQPHRADDYTAGRRAGAARGLHAHHPAQGNGWKVAAGA